MDKCCKNISYRGGYFNKTEYKEKSIKVLGFDTEAYQSGKCFMFATSEGDVFRPEQFPSGLFNRKYQNANFVCYNLKYDESAMLQFLDQESLKKLWKENKVQFGDYKITIIPHKCLTISKKKHACTFYDMYNFYHGSLDANAKKYLGKSKLDVPTKNFTHEYVKENWQLIADYCIQDAILVKELADLIIAKFEQFGVYPKKLYSTAYISYQYFSQKTKYQTVKRYWKEDQALLDFALKSYNGGKFEVTKKGTGYFFEYDIVSAYPYEIANLVSIDHARIIWEKKYHPYAVYGFLRCQIKIPIGVPNPVAKMLNNTCVFYSGYLEKVITKNEYDYFVDSGCDVTILEAAWIHVDHKEYPYKKVIEKLVKQKKTYKESGAELDTHTIKIFLNSLYGKFCQLIQTPTGYIASTCWNPIYATIITANCRLKVTKMQALYPEIIAVHTDSLISTSKLPIETGKDLGQFDFECEGKGLILGCGVYQIGNKTKFRGFPFKEDLFKLFDQNKKCIKLSHTHVNSWREVAFHNWELDLINRFEDNIKEITCDFDRKRLWIDDYQRFSDILKYNVDSLPLWSLDI